LEETIMFTVSSLTIIALATAFTIMGYYEVDRNKKAGLNIMGMVIWFASMYQWIILHRNSGEVALAYVFLMPAVYCLYEIWDSWLRFDSLKRTPWDE